MGVTGQAAKIWRNRCMLRSSILLRFGNPARLQQQLTMRINNVASISALAGWPLFEGPNLACPAESLQAYHNSPYHDSAFASMDIP